MAGQKSMCNGYTQWDRCYYYCILYKGDTCWINFPITYTGACVPNTENSPFLLFELLPPLVSQFTLPLSLAQTRDSIKNVYGVSESTYALHLTTAATNWSVSVTWCRLLPVDPSLFPFKSTNTPPRLTPQWPENSWLGLRNARRFHASSGYLQRE